MDRFDATLRIEKVIAGLGTTPSTSDCKEARKQLRDILQQYAGVPQNREKNIADTIFDINKNGEKSNLQDTSLMLLRIFSVPNLLPQQTDQNRYRTAATSLFDEHLAPLYKHLKIETNDQTYQKDERLNSVHSHCVKELLHISGLKPKIELIAAHQNQILRSLADPVLNIYLGGYEISRLRSSIKAILTQIISLSESEDSGFIQKQSALSEFVSEEYEYCQGKQSFLLIDHYVPFLNTVSDAIAEVVARARDRFKCEIKSLNGNRFRLEKKFPLQANHRTVFIPIPLANTGPGIADRVKAYVTTKDPETLIEFEEIELGGIRPGEFVLPISIETYKDRSQITLDILLNWRVVGDSEEGMLSLEVDIDGQSTDIDWAALEELHPYDLGIATGEDFYGRQDKLNRLYQRLSQERMQSSYITGQRRVGKSSLAKAVEDKVLNESSNCRVLNIECGDFKHPNGTKTVESLGEQIEQLMSQELPPTVAWTKSDLSGSLAPLAKLANLLQQTAPNTRFLIVIDEFDEINQELYRHSELAETFFLNLRSLSGKPNICFILVGAERMSFVMQAQGEKLNRFNKESLDRFHQVDEWNDFENLVKSPTKHAITWHDNAVREVYNFSNGHPYFAKQICGKIFERAVLLRDAEISLDEVRAATDELVTELDVNAFQHFWRDGVQGDSNDTEIVALKRCRVLIGLARTARAQFDCSLENIEGQIHSNQLQLAEIPPILADFCRRQILKEEDGIYTVVIPLFSNWLINNGFNLLIADHLGDELEEEKQRLEDEAHVKDSEIVDLLNSWPSYRGVQISHQAVRDWISQTPSLIDQRLLFKLLEATKFISEAELKNVFTNLHNKVRNHIPVMVRTSKAQRRKDLWITYIDGAGKSGSQFATKYAEENLISTTCVKEMAEIDKIMAKADTETDNPQAILIVDDFIGTGNGLSSGLEEFYERNGEKILELSIPVFVLVVCATTTGEDQVRAKLTQLHSEADLYVDHNLDQRHYAFKNSNLWKDQEEGYRAKSLCIELGQKLHRTNPLGYGNEALLLVLPRNCPNNTLPIFHSKGRGDNTWQPLFERIKH